MLSYLDPYANATVTENEAFQPPQPSAGGMDPKRLKEEIGRILDAVSEEEWLPGSLRCLFVSELLELRRNWSGGGKTDWAYARSVLEDLAMSCFIYQSYLDRSRAMQKIRSLDLELADREIRALFSADS